MRFKNREFEESNGLMIPSYKIPWEARNFCPTFGAPFQSAFATPATVNPLASVPWVAQWKFNNNGNDSIGANNLTPGNSPTFTTGKLGGATGATQLVAASSQYWTIADNAALSMGDLDFTICAWVYLDSKTFYMPIVGKTNVISANVFEYSLSYRVLGADRFRIVVGSGSASADLNANSFGAASLSVWYCVIAWHDSVTNSVNIQVNNGAVDSMAYTNGSYNSTNPLYVGTWNALVGAYYWDGRIDNVCIAKSAAGLGGVLTAAQRTAFYNAGNGTEVLT